MRLALPLSLVLAVFVVLGAASCGQRMCTPQSCPTGCCSADGTCQPGGENAACGTNGNVCVDCSLSGQICGSSACVVVGGTGGGSNGGGSGGGAGGGGGSAAFVCDRHVVSCSDQAIQQLGLFTSVNSATIGNTADGSGWRSTIDATAGGSSPSRSYVYARFTDQGLSTLPLTDVAALDSMDWDIAFRRFVIRINGGDSGPSCVGAQVMPSGTTYDSITTVPSGLVLEGDDFFTDTCAFLDDGKGLGTSPNTYLSSYYAYPQSCVAMTNQAYVLRLQTGRHVKLTVSTYYATEAAQTTCDTTGTSGGALGGTVRVRWQFLD